MADPTVLVRLVSSTEPAESYGGNPAVNACLLLPLDRLPELDLQVHPGSEIRESYIDHPVPLDVIDPTGLGMNGSTSCSYLFRDKQSVFITVYQQPYNERYIGLDSARRNATWAAVIIPESSLVG